MLTVGFVLKAYSYAVVKKEYDCMAITGILPLSDLSCVSHVVHELLIGPVPFTLSAIF